LWSYYKKFASSSSTAELTTIIYKRDNPKTVAKTLADADVVGFSLYVWNEQISLAIINELKKLNSNVKIICGGP